MNDDTTNTNDAAKAAAKAVIAAVDRLHRAVADASPERGRELLAVLAVSGAVPVCTVRQTDAGCYAINVGLMDAETGKNLETFAATFNRTDISMLPILRGVAP